MENFKHVNSLFMPMILAFKLAPIFENLVTLSYLEIWDLVFKRKSFDAG